MTRAEFLKYCGAALTTRLRWWTADSYKAESGPRRLPDFAKSFGTASVHTENDVLIVSTGQIERRWRYTNSGLLTTSIRDLKTKREWLGQKQKSQISCDWTHAGWLDDSAEARVASIHAEPSNDEGFTSPHLAVTVEFEYPALNLSLRYAIWSYPGAEGLRTQLWLKGQAPPGLRGPQTTSPLKRTDHIPLNASIAPLRRRYAGYFNDTQHRNSPETELIREEIRTDSLPQAEIVDWASFASLETTGAGLLLLKESHKCVNQPGVDTGAFIFDGSGLQNTGWGLSIQDLDPSRYRWCWASWIILHDGSDDGRELSLKRFDRLRFPVSAKRDLYSLACTWGASTTGRVGRDHAGEKEVLPEMKSAHEIGIDMLLIDDGWQVGSAAQSWKPDAGIGWKPNPQVYPGGWKSVTQTKRELGMRLGLWAAAPVVPLSDMEWNWDRLRMDQFKLDFVKLNQYDQLDPLMDKARQFIAYTGHNSMISWDTTEKAPRYGYYWAREYGDIHFMNRKATVPHNVIYVPWLALRDFWHLARYNNLNKYQLPSCNPELVDPNFSDARQYSASYCAATTLMGIPEFMAVTRSYSQQGRQELIRLLHLYNKHRLNIFEGFVFAVGDKPSNAGWTGFQSYQPKDGTGYFIIFRERLNRETSRSIAGRFFREGAYLTMENIRTGRKASQRVGKQGTLQLDIKEPGDFLFLKYTGSMKDNKHLG